MKKYIFHGSVLPERVNANLIPYKCSLTEDKAEVILTFCYSKIVAECFCDDEDVNILSLKNSIEKLARLAADIIGFRIACGYDVEIESVFNTETKEFSIFGVNEPIFDNDQFNVDAAQGIIHPEINISMTDLFTIAGKDTGLIIALSDFRQAIRQPSFTSFYCYRAIEALKNTFPGKNAAQWENFRDAANVSEEDIKKVMGKANNLRHGKPADQSWETRKEHMLLTWNIIKNYFSFSKSNTDEANKSPGC